MTREFSLPHKYNKPYNLPELIGSISSLEQFYDKLSLLLSLQLDLKISMDIIKKSIKLENTKNFKNIKEFEEFMKECNKIAQKTGVAHKLEKLVDTWWRKETTSLHTIKQVETHILSKIIGRSSENWLIGVLTEDYDFLKGMKFFKANLLDDLQGTADAYLAIERSDKKDLIIIALDISVAKSEEIKIRKEKRPVIIDPSSEYYPLNFLASGYNQTIFRINLNLADASIESSQFINKIRNYIFDTIKWVRGENTAMVLANDLAPENKRFAIIKILDLIAETNKLLAKSQSIIKKELIELWKMNYKDLILMIVLMWLKEKLQNLINEDNKEEFEIAIKSIDEKLEAF